MKRDTVRGQLRDVHARLAEVEAERDALLAVARGLEALLRTIGPDEKDEPDPEPDTEPGNDAP